MLDYSDLLLPYVNITREDKGTTLYGSRILMLLTPVGTLHLLAIELTRPPSDKKSQWKHVYTPTWDTILQEKRILATTFVVANGLFVIANNPRDDLSLLKVPSALL
ncbi:hypothetical protein L1987_68910 [Smallanthus sonchifolius]|uniref:Uncharacterized protein n=1 Tax=Smallanthus sonchifolius TaxID=185202 RepID=A0ACB9B4A4_9ASTR|nr:hypothetical protein L1987_68910 [Smallanthus sonchifolius]